MTPHAAAYDNIRLIRRKILIAQDAIAVRGGGSERDDAVIRLALLTDQLVDAVQDFATLGFEAQVAEMLGTPI